MFVARGLMLVVFLGVVTSSLGKTYTQCELARELVSKGLPRNKINDWVCLVESESSRRTDIVSRTNSNGSRDYGLFQINSKYWCTESGPAGKDCNIRCRDLLDDNIDDDVQCAKKVFKRHNFNGAWYGWLAKCGGGRAKSVDHCF